MSNFRKISNPSVLTTQEQDAKKTRAIVGDGTAFLIVPGLLSLTAIAVGTATGRMSLPLTEDRLHMVHPDDTEPRELVTETLFAVESEGYDEAILLRSELSNGGRFQKGVNFYVTGEWAQGSETKTTPDPGATPDPAPVSLDKTPASDSGKAPESEGDTNAGGEAGSAENTDGEGQADPGSFVDESFSSLPPDLQAKVGSMGSLEAALSATNEQFNAVGISGADIGRVKRVLAKIAPAA